MASIACIHAQKKWVHIIHYNSVYVSTLWCNLVPRASGKNPGNEVVKSDKTRNMD